MSKVFGRRSSDICKTKKDVVEKIVNHAIGESFLLADPIPDRVRRALKEGRRLPTETRPGFLIQQLPAEERELLKDVTEKDFNHRIL